MSAPPLEEKVSVIIPCYNVADYLEDTVTSVINQSYQHWECIVVDDGSSDESLHIARRLSTQESRIRILTQDNRGQCAARNHGLREATGSVIQLLDGDDLLAPDKLSIHVRVLLESPDVDIVYGDSWAFFGTEVAALRPMPPCAAVEGNPLREFALRWEKGLSIPMHPFLYRRSCFERWGGLDERLRNHVDWDLYLRFAAAGAKFRFVPGRLALYRVRAGSITRNADAMHHGKCLVLSKHLVNTRIPLRYRYDLARQFCSNRLPRALDLLRSRQWRAAAAYVTDPGLGRPWSYACIPVLMALIILRVVRALPRRARWLVVGKISRIGSSDKPG